MPNEIEQYSLAWHPKNGAAYRIKLKNSSWSTWNQIAPADLSALASILRETPVFFDGNGWISTGAEGVGN